MVHMAVHLTRRTFAGALLASPLAFAKKFDKPLGVQLYTLRRDIPKDPKAIIDQLAAIGYKEVEAIFDSWPKVSALVKDAGLKATSIHLNGSLLSGSLDGLPKIVDQVKADGFPFAVMPYVNPQDRGGADQFKKLADRMNTIGEAFAKVKIQFCYHHHAFEFATVDGNKTGMDIFMETFNPKLVKLEVDVMWLAVAGNNPAEFLLKHKGRVPLIHVKDLAKDTPNQFSERVPPTAFKEVGAGSLDIAGILKAAMKSGVKHYFVEQDQTPGPAIPSLKQSYEALRQINV
jgi:sugar phosphate isomerase/epimerase